MVAQIVAVVFVVATIVQLAYAVGLFLPHFFSYWNGRKYAVATHRAEMPEYPVIPISVIICAHNEEVALTGNLEKVLQQNYHGFDGSPCYEVIVVNDRSDDGSATLLERLSGQYQHLRVLNISVEEPRRFPGKKDALSRGVASAKYDHILMTDADCRPGSKAWILWMAYPFTKGKEIVAGYGAYEKGKGLLNRFIRCETIHTFVQMLSFTRAGLPYMAVGRNLAATKQLLLKIQADPLYSVTTSGDDDMLVRVCGTKENMVVNVHSASFTYSKGKGSLGAYIQQKQRHVSTGKYYRQRVQYMLGGYALSHGLTWLCSLIFLVFPQPIYATVGLLWILRGPIVWVIFSEYSDRLADDWKLKFFWPIFDLGWAIYNLILSPYILWKNKQQWK